MKNKQIDLNAIKRPRYVNNYNSPSIRGRLKEWHYQAINRFNDLSKEELEEQLAPYYKLNQKLQTEEQ